MVFDMILTLDTFAVLPALFWHLFTQHRRSPIVLPYISVDFFLLIDIIDPRNRNFKTGATTLSQVKKCFLFCRNRPIHFSDMQLTKSSDPGKTTTDAALMFHNKTP